MAKKIARNEKIPLGHPPPLKLDHGRGDLSANLSPFLKLVNVSFSETMRQLSTVIVHIVGKNQIILGKEDKTEILLIKKYMFCHREGGGRWPPIIIIGGQTNRQKPNLTNLRVIW